MKITILAVGKLRESYWREAFAEYVKRMGKYTKIEINEVSDDEKILTQLTKYESAFVITCDVGGQNLSSENLGALFSEKLVSGKSHFVFIIGGAEGFGDNVRKKSDFSLSFSKMTFPHQMMRVILAEQLYRALDIINGGKYHK